MAPNQRAKDRKSIMVWLPIELYVGIKRKADQLGLTVSAMITAFIAEQTKDVKLTDEDYEEIRKWLSRP